MKHIKRVTTHSKIKEEETIFVVVDGNFLNENFVNEIALRIRLYDDIKNNIKW